MNKIKSKPTNEYLVNPVNSVPKILGTPPGPATLTTALWLSLLRFSLTVATLRQRAGEVQPMLASLSGIVIAP